MTILQIKRVSPTRFALIGELDMASAPDFDRAVAGHPSDVPLELDLADLSFIDSAGLHAIVRLSATTNGAGPLVLLNVASQARKLFDVVGLDTIASVEVRPDDR